MKHGKVNKEKSEVARIKDVPFLGFQILRGKVRVSDKARTKFKGKVQEAHRVWIKMNKWQSVTRTEVRFVMNLQWFKRHGLIFLSDFARQPPEQS